MKNLNDFAKRQKNIRRFIFTMAVVIVVCSVTSIGFAGYVAVKTVDAVQTQGLKSVIETIWEGPSQ